MTKKNLTAKFENAKGVSYDEKKKMWKMTKTKFSDFMKRDEFSKVTTTFSTDGKYVKLTENNVVLGVVTFTANRNTKPKTENKENVSRETKTEKNSGGKGFKPRNAKYIVKYMELDGKKEKINNDFTTRNDLVAWLKTQSRKNLQYLRIYDEMGNECRKSAWYEKTAK